MGRAVAGRTGANPEWLAIGEVVELRGKEFEVVAYGVDKETETIDYERLRELAVENKPKLIVCGAS